MGSFKDPNFVERQSAAAQARKAALEKFRASAADPAVVERQAARMASAVESAAARKVRELERVERKAAEAEAAKQAEREAAEKAQHELAKKAESELALQAEQKAARDARYAARKARTKGR